MLRRSVVELITTLRDNASLLRADHVLLRRVQTSNSDRMLTALSDVRSRVAVRTSSACIVFIRPTVRSCDRMSSVCPSVRLSVRLVDRDHIG